MALGEASANLSWIQSQITQTQTLRDRFESDFGYLRSEQYQISATEGKWDSFTSNRASREGYKIINTLADSWLKLSIPLGKENENKRKDLSKTERFVYGAINLRDNLITGIPEALPLQASMSFFAPVRGWIGLLAYLYEVDDGKNGKVRPHIAVWDILNTYWISGSEGLIKAASMRYASSEDVNETYKQDVKPNKNGRVLLYDVWDKEEHGVIGGEVSLQAVSGDWLLKPEAHGLKHVPALILPGGSVPLIQSGSYEDTIKNVGESWAVNNRHLYNTENRMGSYLLTASGRVAKTPQAHEYDGAKTGGKFPAWEGSPFEKGSEIPVDISKGEKVYPLIPPELNRDFFAFFEYLTNIMDLGGQAPLPPTAGPAAGLLIKRHEAQEKMVVSRHLMERSYEWLAHELVGQYANGSFEEMELQGVDGRNQRFKFKVKPKDLDPSWQFKAELISDFPQDMMGNVGMAVQLKQSELLSDETIQDQYLHVADTDSEQDKLSRERAYKTFFLEARHLAAVLADQGDEEGAKFILEDIERMKMERQQPEPGIAPQAGIPSPMRPSADTSAVVPTPPGQSKLRNFLSRLGGGA